MQLDQKEHQAVKVTKEISAHQDPPEVEEKEVKVE